ncbi:histone deacetylase [Leptospira sp. 2 VSF19]|uniref:Histone deacetylase n=1 Tax=Leptospira soteropolitanensis TaxID=2950025 RepID=A0AAW5VNP5_9LEPT|nr:histone deacetylase [Leptospira soteropolitanensis]MCW7494245.1 histone deacetylase [Leptospira soteropolitanensis]MCW7501780.1 histone deacetylase [Leptospira soteropolitanensis]MCW7524091.1 histone deacetylase [Leptospira soteropolitanensis]MCW7527956.1 histone deacetylase [Leptospira soteropolitanensis]MCW7531750.1 histone deacetylase [Leptospira soteropolitanensis]
MESLKTGITFHEEFLKHNTGSGHPETHGRLESILDKLSDLPSNYFLWKKDFIEAPLSIISSIHDPSYVRLVGKTCQEKGSGYLDGDTVFSSHSFTAASLAVGAGLYLADEVLLGNLKNGMALVRPPGHHAEADHAMGFCIFNNIAITAKYLQSKGIKRILILDWDVHHGNGTQHQFYEDDTVYFISLHQYPFYPGTGAMSERGIRKGLGTTLNLPLARGAGEFEYLSSFPSIQREMEKFQPEFVLVSAGFDAHKNDPLGGMNLSTSSFEILTQETLKIANTYANGRMISFLEGGYDLNALAESVKLHLESLAF